MLILNRRPGQEIDITLTDGRHVRVGISSVRLNQARVYVVAPKDISVDRAEIRERKLKEQRTAAESPARDASAEPVADPYNR